MGVNALVMLTSVNALGIFSNLFLTFLVILPKVVV